MRPDQTQIRLSPVALVVFAAGVFSAVTAGAQAIPDTQIAQDFAKRIAVYQSLHKNLEAKLPKLKSTGSSNIIDIHQKDLARAIRQARANAKQGDIFTPPVCIEFRRLASLAMHGENAFRVEKSLQDSEPVKFDLKVNIDYPPGVPKQSMPPTLLGSLPALPPELEYRLLGSTLVLLDAKAGVVVDLDPGFLP